MLAEPELWPVSLNLIRPLSATPGFQLQRRHYPGAVSPPPLSSCQALSTVFMCIRAFSDGSAGKETACNAGDVSLIPGSGRSPGGGHGNPRQYSCLKNPMDWEAWRTTVQGVAKSQTRLSTSTFRCISWSDIQQLREEVLLWSQSSFHMKKQESIRLWSPLTKSICQANNRGRWGGVASWWLGLSSPHQEWQLAAKDTELEVLERRPYTGVGGCPWPQTFF